MLIIFLIVLGVIGKWVVPPVSRSWSNAKSGQTADRDNRESAEQVAAIGRTTTAAMAGPFTGLSHRDEESPVRESKVVDQARAAASGGGQKPSRVPTRHCPPGAAVHA